jgi:hypothetical protein
MLALLSRGDGDGDGNGNGKDSMKWLVSLATW